MSRKGLLWTSLGVAIMVAGVIWATFWLLRQSLPGAETVEQERTWVGSDRPASGGAPGAGAADQLINVTLSFLSPSGTTLAPEEREIPFENSLPAQAKRVVGELLSGSRSGLRSPFPEDVRLLELFVTPQGMAVVDFSNELVANHPGGSSFESLTVYSLSNTLIANFPAIKQVQIVIEGRETGSLAGHLDLTVPYGRAPRSLEQPPSPPGP